MIIAPYAFRPGSVRYTHQYGMMRTDPALDAEKRINSHAADNLPESLRMRASGDAIIAIPIVVRRGRSRITTSIYRTVIAWR